MATVLTLQDIEPLVDVASLIDAIETGFVKYSEGQVVVPPVGFLNFEDPPGDVHIKYGYIRNDDVFVLKVASGFPANVTAGLAPSDGAILVFNQQTGHLVMVLHDECWLTDMRTAAAGAVAARHLAPSVVNGIGIVGTGVQARMQLEMLRPVVDCKRCMIWGRDAVKVAGLIEQLQSLDSIRNWGIELIAATGIGALASDCNLIVTTTSAREALLQAEDIKPGTHITAMGSDDHGKQELAAAILGKADRVVADSRSQCIDHGECHFAVAEGLLQEDGILELGQVIQDPQLGRTDDQQITVADLTGVAVQDIQIARMVADRFEQERGNAGS